MELCRAFWGFWLLPEINWVALEVFMQKSNLIYSSFTKISLLRKTLRGTKVKAERPIRRLLQYFRQEMMVDWNMVHWRRWELVRFWMFLKIEPTVFPDRLEVEYEIKGRISLNCFSVLFSSSHSSQFFFTFPSV